MSTTSPEALGAQHPVAMIGAAAALGVLLGLGGVAMVAGPHVEPPASDPPAGAAQRPGL